MNIQYLKPKRGYTICNKCKRSQLSNKYLPRICPICGNEVKSPKSPDLIMAGEGEE